MFLKNTSGQGVVLFARNTSSNAGEEGDAANITAYVSLDGASPSESTNSVAEIDGGLYWLDLEQSETNANIVCVTAASDTENVVIDPVVVTTTAGILPTVAFGTSGGLPTYSQVDSIDTDLSIATSAISNVSDNVDDIMGTSFVAGTHALDQQASVSDVADGVLDEALSGHTNAGTPGAALQYVYWVEFEFIGGSTTDKYRGARWIKNGIRVTSGVTSPTIQVIDCDDGTDLIAETAMSEAGSSELFYYDATGSGLTTAGTAYKAVFTATIDGATRTYEQGFIRSSS